MKTLLQNKVVWGAILVAEVLTQSGWGQVIIPPKGMGAPYRANPQSQQNFQNPKQQMTQTPFQGSGTIEAIGSHGIQIEAQGTKWNVAPDKNCRIEVTGTADSSFLKPGMLVKFSGTFDKKGKAASPITELDIVSPQTAMPSNEAHAPPPAGGSRLAGKKNLAAPAAGSAPVVGQLKAFANNELTVDSGTGTVKADLSPTASIKVNVSEAKLAQVGDKVEVRGYYMQQPNVFAHEIKITLANPLGDKKPAAKPDKSTSTSSAN